MLKASLRKFGSVARPSPASVYTSSFGARRLWTVAAGATAVGVGYLGVSYYVLDNPEALELMIRYVPGAEKLVDMIEEREHARKVKVKEQYYVQQGSVEPYIRRKYPADSGSDLHSSTSSSFSSSSLNSTASSRGGPDGDSATAALDSTDTRDPLASKHFFDAQSGIVTQDERDYLPLILMPDYKDPNIYQVCTALNDLISSLNASAASEDTVMAAAKALKTLSKSVDDKAYRDIFADKASALHKLAKSRTELSPQDYRSQLAQQILDTENHLVAHVNSGVPPVQTSSSVSSSGPKLLTRHEYMDAVLQLQVNLVLLVSAIHNHSSGSHYIAKARGTISQLPTRSERKRLINDALKGIHIPEDVDLTPVINDLLK
uniref:MICOS complex subunit MIC60 n=1 Tax=Blastobotrys adeninivorans TaxID=409370 RepID=A0A060TCX8_BLAAD